MLTFGPSQSSLDYQWESRILAKVTEYYSYLPSGLKEAVLSNAVKVFDKQRMYMT